MPPPSQNNFYTVISSDHPLRTAIDEEQIPSAAMAQAKNTDISVMSITS